MDCVFSIPELWRGDIKHIFQWCFTIVLFNFKLSCRLHSRRMHSAFVNNTTPRHIVRNIVFCCTLYPQYYSHETASSKSVSQIHRIWDWIFDNTRYIKVYFTNISKKRIATVLTRIQCTWMCTIWFYVEICKLFCQAFPVQPKNVNEAPYCAVP